MSDSSTFTYGGPPKLDLDTLLDRALTNMQGEPDPVKAAATLFLRWAEGDSAVAALLPELMRPCIERRVRERAKVAAR